MDKDDLAALDRAATQGVWKTVKVDGIPYMQSVINDHTFPAEAPDDLYFAAALANAYRTGDLVLIDDGAVERVGRALESVSHIAEREAVVVAEPAPYRCKHGCERDALMARATAAEAENARLREALGSIKLHSRDIRGECSDRMWYECREGLPRTYTTWTPDLMGQAAAEIRSLREQVAELEAELGYHGIYPNPIIPRDTKADSDGDDGA